MRFSDEKLATFYQEFKKLTERVDRAEVRDIARDEREIVRDEIMSNNSATIREMRDDTKSLVQAWGDAQSVVRVGVKLGSVAKWAAGVTAAIAGVSVAVMAALDKFKG